MRQDDRDAHSWHGCDTPAAQPPTLPELSCVLLFLAMVRANAYSQTHKLCGDSCTCDVRRENGIFFYLKKKKRIRC